MLQTAAVASERMLNWFRNHPSVAQTDQNIAILTKYIREYFSISGETVIDEMYLDLAYRNIGATMQHLVGPEVHQEIAKANQQAQALLAEKQAREAEAERERKRIETEHRREQLQRNRTPGAASAFEGATNRAESERQASIEAQKARDAITLRARHQQFDQLVREARMEASAELHSRKHGRWNALYAKIKQKFPEPEFTATF